jgi:hypothetical protein
VLFCLPSRLALGRVSVQPFQMPAPTRAVSLSTRSQVRRSRASRVRHVDDLDRIVGE